MRISRRTFARLSLASGLTTLLAACRRSAEVPAPPALPIQAEPGGGGGMARYREAPMLAEQVARGTLRPVDERLPEAPYVLEVNGEIGTHGGAWRRAYRQIDTTMEASLLPLDNNLVHLDRDLALKPYIAESWEANEEGTRLTWHLRRGMCWSNGDPVTSQDFYFAWFADYGLAELQGFHPAEYLTVELPDDHTFTIIRATPSLPTLPSSYLSPDALRLVPSTHARQYHPDYVEGGLAVVRQRAQAEGYPDWGSYYRANVLSIPSNPRPGTPTLLPWRPLTPRSTRTILYERNPYFWQVDAQGQQLPYLDHVLCLPVGGEEPLEMRIENGELDCQVEGLLPHREDAYRQAGYQVQHYPSGEHIVLQLNPSTSDQALATLFAHREARQALSLAINRDQLSVLYEGLAEPRQFSPIPQSPFYDEALSGQYLEYDPVRAGAILDRLGYGDRNAEGYRVSPEGERLWLIVQSPYEPESVGGRLVAAVLADLEALGLECDYWVRSGYDIWISQVHGALRASVGPLGGTLLPTLLIMGGFSPWSPNAWRGFPPLPDDHFVHRLDALFDEMARQEPDIERRNVLFRDYLQVWKEELPLIGLLGGFTQVGIAKDGFANVMDGLVYDEVTNYEAFQHPQQFTWRSPQSHTLSPEELADLLPAPGQTPTTES